MKKIILLVILLLMTSAIVLALQGEPSGQTELRGQVCAAEDNANSANTYADACDGTYPSSCTTDLLSCNDGSVETHAFSKDKFGGVRIQDYNNTVTDCGAVSEVFLCYEWWVSGGTLTNCLVAVDANGGGSYSTVSSTCPGTVANPGIICTNVTSLELWTCSNFFNTTGTRAFAKLENSRSNTGPASTQSVDALFFNVTYSQETDPPTLSLLSPSPSNASFINTATPTINFSVIDLGSNIDTCTLQLDHTNYTMTKNATGKNIQCNFTTSSLGDGSHNYTVYANDTLGNLGSNGTFFFTVDTTFPLISYGTGTESDGTNFSRSNIYVNVSVTETNFANITFILKNDTATVNETIYSSLTLEINWTNLVDANYTYNVSIKDSANNINTTAERKISLDNLAPNVSTPLLPISGNNFSGTFVFNVSITDATLSISSVTLNVTNSSGVQNATFIATQQGDSGYWNASINTSHFPEGTYNISILANDTINNLNDSEMVHTLVFDNTPPGFTLNLPANDSISQNDSWIINTTIAENLLTTTVKIYGANESGFYNNNSLLYKRTGIANNTEITYNWTSSVLNATSDTQLLMHFDLEGVDNATFVQDETGLNNGTKLASGAPVWNSTEAKFGYSLGFDGIDDTVTINDSNSLDLNGSFSISFWTFPTSLSSNMTFLSKGFGTTATNYYIDYKTTTEVEFGFFNGAFRSVAVDASDIAVNQWSLITVTLNDTSNISRVYINGVKKGSLQLNFDAPANSFDMKIGSYPGFNQNYTGLIDELVIYNKTLSDSEVSNIFQLISGDWYWRVDLNDTASNLNISETRVFTIGTIWSVSPTDLGSVGSGLNTNVSVGTLLINNTHAYRNVTINITYDFNGTVTLNDTLPLNLTGAGGNWTRVQINVTSPSTEVSTTINFNITATEYSSANSVPASRTVPVILVATSANPFLITTFETVPSIVSQNNTGINLKASVINRGQGNAQNVKITYELPAGWTNTSGALTSNANILNVNNQVNYSIEVDIADNATSGVVTLYANITGQNATGEELSSSLKTIGNANVTVNAVSAGEGPSTTTTPPAVSTGGGGNSGGSGGASSSGGSLESVAFSESVEVIRGENGEASFDILIAPKYSNSSLENLTLIITGYPEQYITISPLVIKKIKYEDEGKFFITLSAPTYVSYEEYNLTAIIKGKLVRGSGITSDYIDKRSIHLIIQEIALSPAVNSLEVAERAVQEMIDAGFNTKKVEKLLKEAKDKLEERRNKEAQDLAKQIIPIRDLSFEVNDLLRRIKEALKNPRKMSLITGNVPKEFFDIDGKIIFTNSLLTGNSIFAGESSEGILGLAEAAFVRGDYETALERARSAQVLLILERKGNFGLFLYLYWYFVLIGAILFSISGLVSYRSYRKVSVTKKIGYITKEEENIRQLMTKVQQDYFSGKVSSTDHKSIMNQHQKRLSQLRKDRLKLRNQRIKILKGEQIMNALELEQQDAERVIKILQEDYYKNRKIPESEYKLQFSLLNERLAEIEDERATLDLVKQKGKIKVTEKVKSKKKKIDKKRDFKVNGISIAEKVPTKRKTEIKEKELDSINFDFSDTNAKKLKRAFSGAIEKAKESVNKVKRKLKNNNNRERIVILDGKFIENVKEQIKDKDVKGKWIEVNLKETGKTNVENFKNSQISNRNVKFDKLDHSEKISWAFKTLENIKSDKLKVLRGKETNSDRIPNLGFMDEIPRKPNESAGKGNTGGEK